MSLEKSMAMQGLEVQSQEELLKGIAKQKQDGRAPNHFSKKSGQLPSQPACPLPWVTSGQPGSLWIHNSGFEGNAASAKHPVLLGGPNAKQRLSGKFQPLGSRSNIS